MAAALVGCNTDMWRMPRQQAYDPSDFYADGQSARPLVPGTIPRGYLREDGAYYTGAVGRKLVTTIPMPLTKALLDRGQDRFDVFCSPCHGRLGDGNGMIANRGFSLKRQPGNYHTDRLRAMPVGHFYNVITNGYGTMFSYASRVEPQDRWAIAAYIRVLQMSQMGKPSDLPAAEMEKLSKLPANQTGVGPTSWNGEEAAAEGAAK